MRTDQEIFLQALGDVLAEGARKIKEKRAKEEVVKHKVELKKKKADN